MVGGKKSPRSDRCDGDWKSKEALGPLVRQCVKHQLPFLPLSHRETTAMSVRQTRPAMGTDGIQIKQEPIDEDSDNRSASSGGGGIAENDMADVQMECDEISNGHHTQTNGDNESRTPSVNMDGDVNGDEQCLTDNGHSPLLTNGVDSDLHVDNNNTLLKDAAEVERSIEVKNK